ncbi:glycosyltransferase family 39 protein [Edaphobacter modestus]|nr:glycosyltransferase family 39 protein [Edaphobacter modestus]
MTKDPLIRKRQIIEGSLAILVLLAGLLIRIQYLDERPFWVDEAESSINALTILENGYPTDAYLGIPIYENTLIQPWPGNAEYEFRDLSYSDKHVAVYHGWLPLYAIAGSFALHGVTPDFANGVPAVKHDLNEWKRRTRAARLPAILFGVLFLAVIFAGGRILYGPDAAWAGLLVGSIYPYHIAISRQARYYSAEVALTTACAVSLWLLVKDCKWKHVYLAAAAFVLLFYTHILSFTAASLVCLLVAPVIVRRHVAGVRKLTTFAALATAGTLPWIFVTEFYRQQGHIPRAWPLLNLPSDFWRYPPVQVSSAAAGIIIALLTAWVVLMKPRVSLRLAAPAKKLAPVLLFLGVWAVCGYATFVAFVPAVSFDSGRLNLSYWGPLFLLASVTAAAITRVLVPRYSLVLAPVLLLMVFMATGRRPNFHETFAAGNWKADAIVLDRLGATSMDRTTKLYAAPNDHLILSFYSGLPVQDITPVRKSYLDAYPGNIIYIDRSVSVETGFLTAESIQEAALRDGYRLSPEAAETWSILLRTRDYREAMLKSVSRSAPQEVEAVPPFGRQLLTAHHRKLPSVFTSSSLELVTRGFAISSWTDWRNVLKYRFIGPEARSSVHANYADRLRGSDAVILSNADTALYLSRWHPADVNDGIEFRFVR